MLLNNVLGKENEKCSIIILKTERRMEKTVPGGGEEEKIPFFRIGCTIKQLTFLLFFVPSTICFARLQTAGFKLWYSGLDCLRQSLPFIRLETIELNGSVPFCLCQLCNFNNLLLMQAASTYRKLLNIAWHITLYK